MRYLSTLVVMFCLLQCRPDDPRRQESVGPDLLPGAYRVSLPDVEYKYLHVDDELFSEDRFPLSFRLVEDSRRGLFGFIDRNGNVVIEFRSDNQTPEISHHHWPFKEGLTVVQYVTGDEYKEYCLQRMKKALGKEFDPSMNSIYQCENRIYDMIDNTGKITLSAPVFSLQPFSEGLAASSFNNKGRYGFIDRSGKIVIPEIYDHTSDFNDGLALVKLKKETFFINKKGKKVFGNPYNPEDARYFSDGMSVIRKGGNTKPLIFLGAYIQDYWDGGLLGYMNTTGKVVIEPKFSRANSFHDGLAYVEAPNGEKGYIDKAGKFKIQFKDLETSRSFSDGLAYVEFIDDNFDKKIGFVDTSGKLVLDLIGGFLSSQYDKVGDFSEGLAVVYTKDPNRRMLFIDKTGKVAFDVNDINRKIWERFKKH